MEVEWQLMSFRLFPAMPLSKSNQNYRLLDTRKQMSVVIESIYTNFHIWKLISICPLQNDDHFVSASICWGYAADQKSLILTETPCDVAGRISIDVVICIKMSHNMARDKSSSKPMATQFLYRITKTTRTKPWMVFHVLSTSSNGNIFRVTGPVCGEVTCHLWIPLTKASDAELWCFLWSAPEQTNE